MAYRIRSESCPQTHTNPTPLLWNPQNIHELKKWLEHLLSTSLPSPEILATGQAFQDGQLLFRIVRALAPDFRPSVKMVETSLPFLGGNNIDFYLSFLKELKFPEVPPSFPPQFPVQS
jgi:hypothetical protein